MFGQMPRRVLPDTFEDDVAQIVEQYPGKARARIGDDERDRDLHFGPQRRGHSVDRTLVDKPHRQRDRLRHDDQQQREHDTHTQTPVIGGPQIGQEAAERGEPGGGRLGRFG